MKRNPMQVTIASTGSRPVEIKRKYDAGGHYYTRREAKTIFRQLAAIYKAEGNDGK